MRSSGKDASQQPTKEQATRAKPCPVDVLTAFAYVGPVSVDDSDFRVSERSWRLLYSVWSIIPTILLAGNLPRRQRLLVFRETGPKLGAESVGRCLCLWIFSAGLSSDARLVGWWAGSLEDWRVRTQCLHPERSLLKPPVNALDPGRIAFRPAQDERNALTGVRPVDCDEQYTHGSGCDQTSVSQR
ncbi:hypothetical protein LIA77_02915 [Sarocladium implicatum]|nr:hypothetical protein LIA77_02915 [Sarocladium implicatum]